MPCLSDSKSYQLHPASRICFAIKSCQPLLKTLNLCIPCLILLPTYFPCNSCISHILITTAAISIRYRHHPYLDGTTLDYNSCSTIRRSLSNTSYNITHQRHHLDNMASLHSLSMHLYLYSMISPNRILCHNISSNTYPASNIRSCLGTCLWGRMPDHMVHRIVLQWHQ